MAPNWQIWIDTGGTFTDGMARDPQGTLHRVKVLSSGRLRGQLDAQGRLAAPWLIAPLFEGYTLRVINTGAEFRVAGLSTEGVISLAGSSPAEEALHSVTVELFTGEEAPVLAARLLTQTTLGDAFPPLEMRLGTTKGTNALLERRGARVALLVTRGFRDLLVIGTQQRPNLFELAIPPTETLYEAVIEVDERLTATGDVLQPLTDATIRAITDQLLATRPEAVAISLLNAYRNPIHEQQLSAALQAAGFAYLTCSTGVSASPGYVARTQTTVVDAYLSPVLQSYLANVKRQLGETAILRVMSSTGGLVRADLFQPKDSLLSGPAGGVIGAGQVARQTSRTAAAGSPDARGLLTLDMGGTSTDVARIVGHEPDYRFTTKIGFFELQLPSLAIETVAAGGGSVCWFEKASEPDLPGRLRVGPHSAGASPGPACYGAGGPLTITDVNLLLGRLHPAQFGIPLFPEKARLALEAVARQAGGSATALLHGFGRIADEAMAGAIRTISIARGFDPADYRLLAFGGAGGLHGCSVARLLGMNEVLLPFDGGLLSAYGIGQARIERMAAQAVLRPLDQMKAHLPGLLDALRRQATAELRAEVGPGRSLDEPSVRLFVRLRGQESSVELAYEEDLPGAFRAAYQQRYGHYPANRPIELESVRVFVRTAALPDEGNSGLASGRKAAPAFETGSFPAYDWPSLQPGDTFEGPALLLNTTSSAFIDAGWQLRVGPGRNAQAVFSERAGSTDGRAGQPQLEALQLELFTRRFMSIAEEMGTQLQRTAFSTNVKERLDFSCALLDARAELVANAPHIPVHLGSLGVCARLCLARLPLGPGDVLITNHPQFGGSHLPDVTLLQGVFTPEKELVGYVVNRAHHAEIGGNVPGSMPPDATSLPEEGVVLEPQYVVKDGIFLWEKGADGAAGGLQSRFTEAPYPTRALAENRADIEAALASLRAGETALLDLVQAYGLSTVHRYMARLKEAAAATITAVLDPYEGDTFSAEESLDDGYTIRVRMQVQHRQLELDFRGTSGVHPHNLNANVSILHSVVLYVLRLWCAERTNAVDIPLNEGLMAPVRLVLPPASFLNPVFPDNQPDQCPAVVGGNTEVSQRLVDTLLKALGLAACSYGTMNNFLFGNADFGYYETIGGGTGATRGANGRSGVHQHMTNTRLTDPEELERRYPVRLHRFGIRAGSGGDGGSGWRGGDGIVREIEFLEPVQATLLSQHRVVPPYGLCGGAPGQPGTQMLIRSDGRQETLGGIFTRPMAAGERIRIETPGGGGYGTPSQ